MGVQVEVQVGEVWAYREKPGTPGGPVSAVEVLQLGPARSPKRVRVRWVDGKYAGLDEWVNQSRLICRWQEVEQFVTSENQYLKLAALVGDRDQVQIEAADFVLDIVLGLSATSASMGHDRSTQGMFIVWNIDALPLMSEVELLEAPNSYFDAGGDYYGPWTMGVEVARRVCSHDPDAVLAALDNHEKAYRDAVVTGVLRQPGSTYTWNLELAEAEEELRKLQPMFLLIRTWCGTVKTSEWDRISAQRVEIDRLRTLADEMIEWLKRSGHPVKAGEFRRKLADHAEPPDPERPGGGV